MLGKLRPFLSARRRLKRKPSIKLVLPAAFHVVEVGLEERIPHGGLGLIDDGYVCRLSAPHNRPSKRASRNGLVDQVDSKVSRGGAYSIHLRAAERKCVYQKTMR